MQRNINLKISDYRDSFNEPHKKKPYYLFIEYGSKNFVFSNKDKANRFLTKFKKESTSIYLELGQHLNFLYTTNINCVHVLNHRKYLKNTSDLNNISNRFSFVLTNKITEISIGREVNNFYYSIDSLYIEFRDLLSKNNRSNFLLNQVRIKMKAIRRLRKDLDLILYDANGIYELSNIEISSIEFHKKMRIA